MSFRKYLALSILLVFVLVICFNFIALKSIDYKIEGFLNKEFSNPVNKLKLRCDESFSHGNWLFTNYRKTFKQCNLYTTSFGASGSSNSGYNYDEYIFIPELEISYNVAAQTYNIKFNQIGRHDKNNIINNYVLSFEDDILFSVKHKNTRIVSASMKNIGPVSLIHSSGIEIATIQNYASNLSFVDNEEELGVEMQIAFQFKALQDFISFMKKNNKKTTVDANGVNKLNFDVEFKFERFTQEEQKEMKEKHPARYKNEKQFFKNLIYNINSISFSNSNFDLNIEGLVKKTPRPGMPYMNLNLDISNVENFMKYIQESIEGVFHNSDRMDLLEAMNLDIMITAFIKTLEDFSIIKNNKLRLHVESDAIGTVSISKINFFTFQKQLWSNVMLLKAKGIKNTASEVEGAEEN